MDRQENSALATHIHHLVSGQINKEIEDFSPVADDIISAVLEAFEEDGDPVEIYEWWTVSWDFAVIARHRGEIIIETPFGFVWGRHTTGISLSYDPVVINILANIPD